MAKVKVLKENELIGGTDNTSVYPITHTKAVFNSDNKELDQILNELEQQITSSSLSNFVLDLGFVSQEEGEQTAARSDVAGNRNISFIRFTAQEPDRDYIKTTLIMQWPDGVNATGQLKFTDQSQFRRTVTGATGVEGDSTTAYPWERTAPHYIAYDATRRMIQLQDYLKIVVKEVELPIATSTQDGLMSSSDKEKLDKYPDDPSEISSGSGAKPWTDVVWDAQSNMNKLTNSGEYYIHGQRTFDTDNLPIINLGSGHTFDARLTVLDSSLPNLPNNPSKNTDACVTQVLRMSNRTGGDGHIWIRTAQGSTKSSLTWNTWEKLQGIFEKNSVTKLENLDGYTTNGMYSGIYAGTESKEFYTARFLPGDTFLMITVNGYAVGLLNNDQLKPQITQLLYKLPAETLNLSRQNAEIYLRTGSYNKTDKVWVWSTFTKMVTNADLSAHITEFNKLSREFETAQSDITQLLEKTGQYADRFVDNPLANSGNINGNPHAGLMSQYDKAKLENYPNYPFDIAPATEDSPGLMSAADKTKLDSYPDNPQDISGTGQAEPWIDIDWSNRNMNDFVDSGEYYIHGNRTDKSDNLPIINVGGGHTINARLTVLNSSLNSNPNDKANICVTQILRLSNRKGGDGHVYVRTGQGANTDVFTWSTWEKLMGIFEKNNVLNIEDIDSYTTNGMYSGIYASESIEYGGIQFFQLDTFLMITINGYAVSKLAVPQITQLLYKLPTNNSGQKAEIYIRTGFLDANGWNWGPFLKTVTNFDLDSQVTTLNANINVVSGKADAAATAATEAKRAADSAAGKADTATRMLRFSSIIYDANIEEQDAPSPKFKIVFVMMKGLFVASDGGRYYKVFPGSDDYNTALDGVTKARQDRLYFIQSLEENRYYHYDGVDLRLLTTSEPEIAGRVWNEDNATSKAESYYGSLKALRDLHKRLGLGRYLVTDNRERKKLDPNDSTKYLDGSPAKLDGSEGQCMWCWNGFYANIWHEGSRLIKAVTFDGPVGGETSVWIPAGGISWLGAGVMDRGEAPYTDTTKWKLCSVINNSEQFRGGSGTALDASKYSKAPAAESPQISMLGMPATNISTTNFGNYARKRGEGWEANWFVARFIVEFLFEVIMGTESGQAAFNADKDENGLYQGGFGTGVTDMPDWGGYNGTYPVIPTSVGLEAGDGVCLVPYSLPQTDGAEGEAYKTFNVPVFFGLVGAGFGHLWQWTRGLIMDAGEEKSLVYVTPSMYADYDPKTVADKILVAECPRVSGYIKRKSYQGLCCMPTEVGGSATIRFADYFYTNANTSKGLPVRAAGGSANDGAVAGASCTNAFSTASSAVASGSATLCYFEEDPIIPESEKIEI